MRWGRGLACWDRPGSASMDSRPLAALRVVRARNHRAQGPRRAAYEGAGSPGACTHRCRRRRPRHRQHASPSHPTNNGGVDPGASRRGWGSGRKRADGRVARMPDDFPASLLRERRRHRDRTRPPPTLGHHHSSALKNPRPQIPQGLLSINQPIARHRSPNRNPRRKSQELHSISPRQVRHRPQHAFPPQQLVRERWDVAHVDAGADDGPAGRDGAQGERDERAGRGEDQRGVERLGRRLVACARPLGAERRARMPGRRSSPARVKANTRRPSWTATWQMMWAAAPKP